MLLLPAVNETEAMNAIKTGVGVKKYLMIMSSFFIVSMYGMDLDSGVGLDKELQPYWSSMPLEVMVAVKNENEKDKKIVYHLGGSEPWCMPYSLRTVDPVNLTYVNQIDVDLTPDPVKPILLDPQFWHTSWRLCLDRVNTNDCFKKGGSNYGGNGGIFFDGINSNRLALVAQAGERKYGMYVLHQSPDNAGTVEHATYVQPIMQADGALSSIMLHREVNRCVRGIKNAHQNTDNPHVIAIDDICAKTDINEDASIPLETDGHLGLDTMPSPDKCVTVASLNTNFVLEKAIYLGKNNYLGLTEDGDLIFFWLDEHNQLKYAPQITGKTFKDIDVDETIKTESGFMPRVGLLATNGDVYLTDLRMGKSPILLYSRTLGYPDYIFRFFYDKEQCAVVYNKAMGGYDTFHVWPDNFNLLLACASFKYGQQKYGQSAMAIEEK